MITHTPHAMRRQCLWDLQGNCTVYVAALFVSVPVSVCLPAHVCLPVCLHVCLSVCGPAHTHPKRHDQHHPPLKHFASRFDAAVGFKLVVVGGIEGQHLGVAEVIADIII
jgi:hypothetical protein